MLEALGVLFELIKNFPEFLGAILEIKHLWESHQDQERRDAQVALLKEAILNAKNNKDTTQLKNLVNNIITNQPPTNS